MMVKAVILWVMVPCSLLYEPHLRLKRKNQKTTIQRMKLTAKERNCHYVWWAIFKGRKIYR